MEFTHLSSLKELKERIPELDKAYVLLYKKNSEASECSLKSIEKAKEKHDQLNVFLVDVSSVRDIHTAYNIKTAPSLLVFEKGIFKNVIKGCNDAGLYTTYFDNIVYESSGTDENPQKSVTVYSTPSCSWCNTLKTHLRKNRIVFTDIDVSADTNAAEEMVRRSGQQGVPQTEIDGEIIIGFDKTRINKLLGIN